MKAEVGSEDDKKWLAEALFYLRERSTGSLEGDVVRLGQLIKRYTRLTHRALYY